jgi:hypothetical protein
MKGMILTGGTALTSICDHIDRRCLTSIGPRPFREPMMS